MKGRIYLSEDKGACALIAAALDVWCDRKGMPTAQEVTLWAMETGMNWSQTGWLWFAGEAPGGKLVFFGGVNKRAPILERSLCYLMPMLRVTPLQWEFARLCTKAPRVRSWSGLIRAYPRLSRLIREEMGY